MRVASVNLKGAAKHRFEVEIEARAKAACAERLARRLAGEERLGRRPAGRTLPAFVRSAGPRSARGRPTGLPSDVAASSGSQ